MSSTLAGSLNVSLDVVDAIQAGSAGSLGPQSRLVGYTVPVIQRVVNAFANGTAAGQATRIFSSPYTFAASAASINLATVYCADLTQGFSSVRAVLVWNTDADATHVLKFGDDAVGTALFLGGLKGTHPQFAIQAGACYLDMCPLDAAGWTVDSTHKNLRLDPGAATITFNVVVFGN